MKLTILGSGSFVSNLEHWGPGYLLEIGKKKILIDAGSGVQIQLLKLGIQLKDLDYIFITHFHNDHTSDLFSINFRYRFLKKYIKPELKKKLIIFGPKDMEKFLEKLHNTYGLKEIYKVKAVIGRNISKNMKFPGFTVKSFQVEHMKGVECYAYRFKAEGKIITFSGDTVKCSGIEKACKNADLLIADSSISKNQKNPFHWDTYEIGKVCTKQNVKKVILTHLLPQGLKYDLVSEVKEKFNGEVVLAKDLMKLKI